MGIKVSATNRDIKREKVMVRPIALNSSPAIPDTYTIGRNTAMVVKVEAVIASPTSFAPSSAASTASSPSSRCRKIFSNTTIELSTSMPTPKERPPRVIIFNEKLLK